MTETQRAAMQAALVVLDVRHRLRAALAEQDAEPVAYIEHHKGGDNLIWTVEKTSPRVTPLYAHSPRREWQGLTDEEIELLERQYAGYDIYRAIEAALKEKNT